MEQPVDYLLAEVNTKIDRVGVEGLSAEIWDNDTTTPFSQPEYEAMADYLNRNIDKTIYMDDPETVKEEYPYIMAYRTILFTAESAGRLGNKALRLYNNATHKMRDAIESSTIDEDALITVGEVDTDPYGMY